MYEPRYDAEHQAVYFVSDPQGDSAPFSRGLRAFVCGGMQNPEKMAGIIGRQAAFAPCCVQGYMRTSAVIDGDEIPFMAPDEQDPHSVLTGVVWLDLGQDELEKIEQFELGSGHRKRVEVRVLLGELRLNAYTYIRK